MTLPHAEIVTGPPFQRSQKDGDTAAMGDDGYTCAECGGPVDPELSYVMSVPVGSEPLYHHPACIGLDSF